MRFVSKNSNLYIVLKPGLPAQPLTGTPATPTVSVRFSDGVVDVTDPDLVKLMLNHPGYNSDYISAEDSAIDPYRFVRTASEPQHVVTELKFGHPTGRNLSPAVPALSPEVKKLIADQATELAKKMLPDMVKDVLKSLSGNVQSTSSGKVASTTDNPISDPENYVSPITPVDSPTSEVTVGAVPVPAPIQKGKTKNK